MVMRSLPLDYCCKPVIKLLFTYLPTYLGSSLTVGLGCVCDVANGPK